MEGGDHKTKKMGAASRSWKSQGNDSPTEPPKGTHPC